MSADEPQKLTREEASRHFAAAFNRQVWRLLETRYRDDAETARMVHAAHASHLHWLEVGTPVNWQRGAWLLSRVYAELGDGVTAMVWARECRALHDAHLTEMNDFDTVYAIEAEARAHAILGDAERARELLAEARAAAELVHDPDDRQFVLADLDGGNWGTLAAAE